MQRPLPVAPVAQTPGPTRDLSTEGPKLKDFLHLMKKDRTNVDPIGMPTASVIPSSVGSTDMTSYNYPGYHRPAPLGAEQNDQTYQQGSFPTDGNSYYYHPSAATVNSSASFGSNYPANESTSTAYPAPSSYRAYGYNPSPAYSQFPTNSTSVSGSGSDNVGSGAGTYSLASTMNPPSSLYSSSSKASVLPTQPIGSYSSLTAYPIPATQAPSMATYPSSMAYNPATATNSSSTISSTPQSNLTAVKNNGPSTDSFGPMPFNQASAASNSTPHVNNQQSYAAFPLADNQLSTLPYASHNSQAPTVLQSNISSHSTSHQSYSMPPGYTSQMSYQPPASSTVQTAGMFSVNAEGPQNSSGGQSVFNPSTAGSITSNPYASQQSYATATYNSASSMNNHGTQSSYVDPQYSSYSYANANSATHPYGNPSQQYGYNDQFNAHVDNCYQHGTTGTTNTAPSSGQANFQSGEFPAAASGPPGPQYQQYPYYAAQQPAAPQAYYPPNSYYPTDSPGNTIQSTLSSQGVSNVDLLTLLDLSVPNPSSGALLEPQSHGNLSNTNTHGTTTLTTTNTKTVMEPVPVATLVSSPFEATPLGINSSSTVLIPAASKIDMPKVSQQTKPDPLADAELLLKLAADVDKLDKLVDGLTRKSLNGPTALDTKWKEVQDLQERESARRSISVARCYPMKNRLPDVLPYDHNRIELPTTKDDYINASLITSLSANAPSFIATQTPLPCSQQDFWAMIWEQQVEIAVCLLSDAEMPKTGAAYWPVEKGRDLTSGPWTISLQSSNVRPYCHERILSLTKQVNNILIHNS